LNNKPRRPFFRRQSHTHGWWKLTHGAPLAVFVAAALLILYRLVPVLELVSIAALLALVFQTVLQQLHRIVGFRSLAVVLLIGAFISFGFVFALVIVPNLLEEARVLSSALPKYLNSAISISQRLHQSTGVIPDLSQGLAQIKAVVEQVVSVIPQFLTRTLDLSVQAIATLILAIYMATDPNSLVTGSLRLVPCKHRNRALKLLKAIKDRLQGWIFGTGLAISIIGVGATVGLWILGVPLAISFGFLAGILEVIPYIGSIVGALLPALVALTLSPLKALLVLVLFLVLNQADAHLVQPLVMAQRVHLHPAMVILAFLVLGHLLGLVGVLLAVPAAAVLATFVDEFAPSHL
jgi:predicted PurR-regulated permease PerM